eukprot:4624342-Pleurochrysis_carterae.AAC.2
MPPGMRAAGAAQVEYRRAIGSACEGPACLYIACIGPVAEASGRDRDGPEVGVSELRHSGVRLVRCRRVGARLLRLCQQPFVRWRVLQPACVDEFRLCHLAGEEQRCAKVMPRVAVCWVEY